MKNGPSIHTYLVHHSNNILTVGFFYLVNARSELSLVDYFQVLPMTYIVVVVVVVLTLTHCHNTMQSVVAGQAPITMEWKKYLGSKTAAKTQAYAFHHEGLIKILVR